MTVQVIQTLLAEGHTDARLPDPADERLVWWRGSPVLVSVAPVDAPQRQRRILVTNTGPVGYSEIVSSSRYVDSAVDHRGIIWHAFDVSELAPPSERAIADDEPDDGRRR